MLGVHPSDECCMPVVELLAPVFTQATSLGVLFPRARNFTY